jgi:hypothetical protein
MADRPGDEAEQEVAEQEVAVDDHKSDESDEDGLADEDERGESDESDEDGQDDDERDDELDSEEALRNAIAQLEAGAQELDLEMVRDAGAAALATVLATNTTLRKLKLYGNRIGPIGARSLAAALHNNATLTSLDLGGNNIGAEGARSLAATLDNNATLTSLYLDGNNIGAEGAQSLAATLDNNATLTILHLFYNNIGDEGRIKNLVGDRLRVNKLVPKVALWVASAVARRVELWDDALVLPPALVAPLVLPPALAARAAVLAFGDELLDFVLPDDLDSHWLSPGGRDFAAANLLPRAEAALHQELQRLADAAKRAREGQSSSSSGSRAL